MTPQKSVPKKAVVLLSGGVDSTTTLAIAKEQGYACYALTIDYQQRNHPELQAAQAIAKVLGAIEHRIVSLEIGKWGGSALTDRDLEVPTQKSNDIPITYVPARNTIFLATALAWAEVLDAYDIFIGANVIDYSNYPDCRPEFLTAFEQVAKLATRAGVEGKNFHVHAPLIKLTKSEIIKKGIELGINYEMTISCYDPDEQGGACGVCNPCSFRANGFKELNLPDMTRYGEKINAAQ